MRHFWRVVTFWPRMALLLWRAPKSCRDAVASAILCLHRHDSYHDAGWKLTLYFSDKGYEGALGEPCEPWPPRNPPTTITVGSDTTTVGTDWTWSA